MTSTRVIIYARISQDREETGEGVKRQISDCRDYAQRQGLEVVRVIDSDRSAYSGVERPGFDEALDLIRMGEADGILAWRSDRLYRRIRDLDQLIDDLERTDARIFTVESGHIDLTTPEGRQNARLAALIATTEMDQKGFRTSRAFEELAKQGKWKGGRRPLGYAANGVDVIEKEARALRRAAEMVLEGDSMGKAAQYVTEAIRPAPGKPDNYRVDPRTLRGVLLSYRIAGKRSYSSKKYARRRPEGMSREKYQPELVTDAEWDAILDETTWLRLRAKLHTSTGHKPPLASTKGSLLSGFLFCGECGHRLVLNPKSYVCPSVAQGGCARVSIAKTTTERLVLDMVDLLIKENLQEELKQEPAVIRDPTLERINAEYDELERERKQLIERMEVNLIEHEVAIRRGAEIQARMNELDAERASRGALRRDRARRLANIRSWSTDDDLEKQRSVLLGLISHIIVDKATRRGRVYDPTRVDVHWISEPCGCDDNGEEVGQRTRLVLRK